MKSLILISLLSVASLSAAVNDTLPGDPLYEVKTGVTEQIHKATALSNEADAQIKAEFFAKRVEEASVLIQESQNNEVLINEIREEINTSFYKAITAIEQIEDEGKIADASVSRAIMQSAIEHYMLKYSNEHKALSADLSNYSKIMTESLIEVSLR